MKRRRYKWRWVSMGMKVRKCGEVKGVDTINGMNDARW